jgi:O-antigen/teichoic acid export membrane protein
LGLLSLVFLIGIILFGKNILGLYGEVFTAGYHILLIFTIGIIIDTLAGISISILQFLGKNSLSLKVSFLILISNIALNIIFIPIYGLEAAVISVNISIATVNLFSAIYLIRNYRIRVI